MTPQEFHTARKTVDTPSGLISYVEKGSGPAALFIHGVPLNGFHWRHQLESLGGLRRCIAPDLMGLGYSEASPEQPLDFDAQAKMLGEFLDALEIDTIDLVGNDSGGAVAQILATSVPERIRSLTLTNCDTHDNWPPEPFMPIVEAGKAGIFGKILAGLLADPEAGRLPTGLGVGFEFPKRLSDDILAVYLEPVTATEGSPRRGRTSAPSTSSPVRRGPTVPTSRGSPMRRSPMRKGRRSRLGRSRRWSRDRRTR